MENRFQVNPFAFAGQFLKFCEEQKLVVSEGKGREKKYFLTDKGIKILSNPPFSFNLDKIIVDFAIEVSESDFDK